MLNKLKKIKPKHILEMLVILISSGSAGIKIDSRANSFIILANETENIAPILFQPAFYHNLFVILYIIIVI